jgi:lysophospholipase L1-like esterase
MASPERRRRVLRGLVVALAVYLAAFVGLFIGGAAREKSWVIGAVAGLLLAAVLLQLTLSRVRSERLLHRRLRLWVPVGVSALGLIVALAAAVGPVPNNVGFFSLCLAYMGAGQALSELRGRKGGAPERGLWVLGVCAVLYVAGVLLCLLWAPALALVAALLAAPVGLTLLSEDVMDRRARWPSSLTRGAIAGPVLAVGGAVVLGLVTGMAPLLTLAVAAALFGLVGAIASSTHGDVLLVVTAIGLAWAAAPGPAARDDALRPDPGIPMLVALGDSYMSGEGAEDYFEGTNVAGENSAGRNECRRAPTAYAHRVVTQPDSTLKRVAFFACSGARTVDVLTRTKQQGRTQIQMLEELLARPGLDVRAVVVSIGGNDAEFSTIGITCVAPGSCVDRGQAWLDRLRKVHEGVLATYQRIKRVVEPVAPEARLIAVPYPVPLRRESCDESLLDDDEHRFLHGFVGQLNGAVKSAADAAGFEYLDTMPGAFTGQEKLRICDADPDEIGVHFIALKPYEGIVDQADNPFNFLHNSLHPNPRGHERMAQVLTDWLSVTPPPQQPVPATPAFTPPPLRTVMDDRDVRYCGGPGEPSFCGRDDIPWAITQVGLVLLRATIPAFLIVLGAWLFWLPVICRLRPCWNRLGDRLAKLYLGRRPPDEKPHL